MKGARVWASVLLYSTSKYKQRRAWLPLAPVRGTLGGLEHDALGTVVHTLAIKKRSATRDDEHVPVRGGYDTQVQGARGVLR